MAKPNLAEVQSFYHKYIQKVQEEDLLLALDKNTKELFPFLSAIPAEKWDYRYAEGKWSIKELILHMIDAERIFSYRSLTLARQDKTPLPGFEEDDYAAASKAGSRTKENLLTEYQSVRAATTTLFQSFDEDQLKTVSIINKNPMSVNAIGFIITGHVLHHLQMLKERYLA